MNKIILCSLIVFLCSCSIERETQSEKYSQEIYTAFAIENGKLFTLPIMFQLNDFGPFPKACLFGVGWFEKYDNKKKCFVIEERNKIIKERAVNGEFISDLWSIFIGKLNGTSIEMPLKTKLYLESCSKLSKENDDLYGQDQDYMKSLNDILIANFYEARGNDIGFIGLSNEIKSPYIIQYAVKENVVIYFNIIKSDSDHKFIKMKKSNKVKDIFNAIKIVAQQGDQPEPVSGLNH